MYTIILYEEKGAEDLSFRIEIGDALVLTDYFARATISACGPVMRMCNSLKLIESPGTFGKIIDALPGTLDSLINLAFSLPGTAARTIEHAFRQ